MLVPLCTLEQWQRAANTTKEIIVPAIWATETILQELNRELFPVIATRTYHTDMACGTLRIQDDLLDVTGITVRPGPGSSASTVLSSTAWRLLQDGRIGVLPANEIEYINYSFYGDVEVTATFGFHRNYADAWRTVSSLTADVTDTAALLTFSAPNSKDLFGNNAVETWAMYRIESEYVVVSTVDVNTGQVSALRGVNGSVAAAHLTGAAVERYYPETTFQEACITLAKYLSHEQRQHTGKPSAQRTPAQILGTYTWNTIRALSRQRILA